MAFMRYFNYSDIRVVKSLYKRVDEAYEYNKILKERKRKLEIICAKPVKSLDTVK